LTLTVVVGYQGPVQCVQLEKYRWRIIVDRGQIEPRGTPARHEDRLEDWQPV